MSIDKEGAKSILSRVAAGIKKRYPNYPEGTPTQVEAPSYREYVKGLYQEPEMPEMRRALLEYFSKRPSKASTYRGRKARSYNLESWIARLPDNQMRAIYRDHIGDELRAAFYEAHGIKIEKPKRKRAQQTSFPEF